jgi:hypothetical protein
MGKSNLVPMLVVGGFLAALFVIWQKRQAIAQAQATQPSGYAALVAGINSVSSKVLTKVPLVGGTLDRLITHPVDRLLHGDYESFAADISTGGAAEVTKYADPRYWYSKL